MTCAARMTPARRRSGGVKQRSSRACSRATPPATPPPATPHGLHWRADARGKRYCTPAMAPRMRSCVCATSSPRFFSVPPSSVVQSCSFNARTAPRRCPPALALSSVSKRRRCVAPPPGARRETPAAFVVECAAARARRRKGCCCSTQQRRRSARRHATHVQLAARRCVIHAPPAPPEPPAPAGARAARRLLRARPLATRAASPPRRRSAPPWPPMSQKRTS